MYINIVLSTMQDFVTAYWCYVFSYWHIDESLWCNCEFWEV